MTASFFGTDRRLRPQRLILDLIDAAAEDGAAFRPRPVGDLAFRLTERLPGGAAPGAGQPIDPPLQPVFVTTPSGFLVFFDRILLPDGSPRLSGLPAGRYTLRITGSYYQPLDVAIALADTPPPFDDLPEGAGARQPVAIRLAPSFAYTFPPGASATRIAGRFSAEPAADLHGITVTARAAGQIVSDVYTLDRRGAWLLLVDEVPVPWDAQNQAGITLRLARGAATRDLPAFAATRGRTVVRPAAPLPAF